jgi:hypothetical protein
MATNGALTGETMYKLTQEEFNDRVTAMQEALHIFGDLTDKNMTYAFMAYQQILAKRERPLQLDSSIHGDRVRTPFDDFERPLCPDCQSVFMFRAVPDNPDGVKTQLVCSNADCDTVLNSEHDQSWWFENLRKQKS